MVPIQKSFKFLTGYIALNQKHLKYIYIPNQSVRLFLRKVVPQL